jgi:hypothetical protein
MADIAYRSDNPYRGDFYNRRTDWGAIWVGVFVFMAIWAVFGTLGFAIFANSASATATEPVIGMSVGIGFWAAILTLIAMYVAGRVTGTLAGVTTKHDGLVHGMAMFGLSIVGFIVLVSLGSFATGNTVNTTSTPYVLTVFTNLGWIGFIALILGWLGAMFGGYQSAGHKLEHTAPREIRPAA